MTDEYEQAVLLIAKRLQAVTQCGLWETCSENVKRLRLNEARFILALTHPSGQPMLAVLSQDQTLPKVPSGVGYCVNMQNDMGECRLPTRSRHVKNIVQIQNPKSKRYLKIDVDKGKILLHKRTLGPYKNVRIVGPDHASKQTPSAD